MAVQQQEDFRCSWMGSGLKCAQMVSVQKQQMWLVHSCWDWNQQELCTQMDGKYCKCKYICCGSQCSNLYADQLKSLAIVGCCKCAVYYYG